MNPLTWIPEAYPRSGGLAAAGFYKLLGRPRLDPLTVLVRETAQNSWDARERDSNVRFCIEGWSSLYAEEVATLREVVFPARTRRVPGLERALATKRVDGLIITDRGTKGLGGPLAADLVSTDGVYDWVDFVLNVGKANTQRETGGTYGFGKTITYIVSKANAVVIHSRTRYGGRPQSRLIACAIGAEFDYKRRLHTGRHWWGVDPGDGIPQPETGRRADEIAAGLGLPEFGPEELGTNILVVAPDFGGRTPEQAMTFIAESVTWHLWPKLMTHGKRRTPPMDVKVTLNGEPVPIPAPEDRPPLHGFAQAFKALLDDVPEGRAPDGLERRVVRRKSPRVDIGDIITVPLVARPRVDVDDGSSVGAEDSLAPAAAIGSVCHHVALLRSPELVVDYIPGPVPQEGGTEWAAVFRCSPKVDGHFAAAEPPTHDSWRPELLDKGDAKSIVKVGLQRINEFVQERWGQSLEIKTQPGPRLSTAIVADELAYIVQATPSLGAGGLRGGGGGGGAGARSAKIEILSAGAAMIDGTPATTASVRVTPKPGTSSTRIRIAAAPAVDESGTDPDLDPGMQLLYVEMDGDRTVLEGKDDVIDLARARPVDLVIAVARSADTAVQLVVQAVGE